MSQRLGPDSVSAAMASNQMMTELLNAAAYAQARRR